MGIRKRKNGVWYYRSRMRDGVRKEFSLHTRDKKTAERAAIRHDKDFYARHEGWEGHKTFIEWWRIFEKSVLPQYKNAKGFRRIIPKVKDWHDEELSRITSRECDAYVSRRLLEGAPASTVGLERRLLRTVFQKAVDAGEIEKNPWTLTAPRSLKQIPRIRVLTREEEVRLLAKCRPRMQKIIRFLLLTGLRSQELLDASPKHIIHLPRLGLRVLGKGSKIRVIPLTETSRKLAEEILPIKIAHRSLLANLQRAAARAKVEDITLHDLRRTFATRLAEKQYPIDRLAKILGHASTATTATYYTHLTPAMEADLFIATMEG